MDATDNTMCHPWMLHITPCITMDAMHNTMCHPQFNHLSAKVHLPPCVPNSSSIWACICETGRSTISTEMMLARASSRSHTTLPASNSDRRNCQAVTSLKEIASCCQLGLLGTTQKPPPQARCKKDKHNRKLKNFFWLNTAHSTCPSSQAKL